MTGSTNIGVSLDRVPDPAVSVSLTRVPSSSCQIIRHNGNQYLIWVEQKGPTTTTGQKLNPQQWEQLIPSIQRLMASSDQQHAHDTPASNANPLPSLADRSFTIEFGLETQVKVDNDSTSYKLESFDHIPCGTAAYVMPISTDITNAVFKPEFLMTSKETGLPQLQTTLLPPLQEDLGKLQTITPTLLKASTPLGSTQLDTALSVIDINHRPSFYILPTITDATQPLSDLNTYFSAVKNNNNDFNAAQTVVLPVQIERTVDGKTSTHYAAFIIDKTNKNLIFYDPTGEKADLQGLQNLRDAIQTNLCEPSTFSEIKDSPKKAIAPNQSGRMIIALTGHLLSAESSKKPIDVITTFIAGTDKKNYNLIEGIRAFFKRQEREIQQRMTALNTGIPCGDFDVEKLRLDIVDEEAKFFDADDGASDSTNAASSAAATSVKSAESIKTEALPSLSIIPPWFKSMLYPGNTPEDDAAVDAVAELHL